MSLDHPTLMAATKKLSDVFADHPRPTRAVICGSGWSKVTEGLTVLSRITFEDIPGLGSTSIQGHAGEVVLADLSGTTAILFKGRRHFYEGDGWTPVAIPVWISRELGVTDLLLTNSAGSIRQDWDVGNLMLITDHINLMGDNPLVGPHLPAWGPRFPDLTNLYRQTPLQKAAVAAGIRLRSGIYAATRGPVYETPAEIRAWKQLGIDAVGMSTVPEAMLAHAAGLRVSAVSCLTNHAAGISPNPLSHDEVTSATEKVIPEMRALVTAWLAPTT